MARSASKLSCLIPQGCCTGIYNNLIISIVGTHHGEINDQVKLSREQITTSTSTYLVEMQSGSILLRVAGSLLFMLLFYCPVIDDPG
jgi:hypothetical protein